MYVIIAGDNPKIIVATEADAQELVADLDFEFLHNCFNYMMLVSTCSVERALQQLPSGEYWYKKVKVL